MARMSDIVCVREGDMDVTVQPGIKWEDLNTALKPHGLFFPMDPGPGASIGGMVLHSHYYISRHCMCTCVVLLLCTCRWLCAGGHWVFGYQRCSVWYHEAECAQRQGRD